MESESDSHSTGTSEGSTPGIDWKTARSTGSEGTGDGSHGSVMFKVYSMLFLSHTIYQACHFIALL